LENGHSNERRASSISRAEQLARLLLELLEIDQDGAEFIVLLPDAFARLRHRGSLLRAANGATLLDLTQPYPLPCQR
jgi:hypothetical protein